MTYFAYYLKTYLAFYALDCYLIKMKSIMIQGTSSHAGKTVLVAALLRIFKNKGFSCAPFKPQNMALNSFVTPDGYEIGRAQAMQAEAAAVVPSYFMNPILLKPTTDNKAQVIVKGKPWKNLSAKDYLKEKIHLRKAVKECFEELCDRYDIVVVEGAGSPAEINLRKNDLANMGFALLYNLPVLIVGDIDRGGVYASFYGTYSLLKRNERALVKGFIINKFRGDESLLKPANDFLEKKTKIPVLGVVPFFKDFIISDEDGVSLQENNAKRYRADNDFLKIRVIKLPRISNFTDFEPLTLEEDVDLKYITSPVEAFDADFIIIPGSKNTIEDLLFLKKQGFGSFIKKFVERGGFLAGICGGYQMLGRKVYDPYKVESDIEVIDALGLLDTETILEKDKQLKQVSFSMVDGSLKNMKGYEIHMGKTIVSKGKPLFIVKDEWGADSFDGVQAENSNVFGTYMHGLFENDAFRLKVLNNIRKKKGMHTKKKTYNYLQYKDRAYDMLAKHVEKSINLDYLFSIIGI